MRKNIGLIVLFFIVNLYALTSGPNQPEYAGFTPSTTEGMVDLLTGDFTYSIPIMEVPGPSFSLPLTLGARSGIQLEQEANWVGLGWNLTPGAIRRNPNMYPDDYLNAQSRTKLRANETVSGWDGNIGITVLGAGIGVNFGERSDQGGHFGLSLKCLSGSMNLAEYNERDGWNSAPQQNTSYFSQIMGTVEWFAGEAISSMAESAQESGSEAGQKIGDMVSLISQINSVLGGNVDIGKGNVGFSSSTMNVGAFHSSSTTISGGGSIGIVSISGGITFSKSWIHKTATDTLFGYLNLQHFPVEKRDEKFDTKYDKMEYSYTPELSPRDISNVDDILNSIKRLKAFPASTPDAYNLNVEGLSTSFRPYRQDIGEYFGKDRIEAKVPDWINYIEGKWWGSFFDFKDKKEEEQNLVNRRVGEWTTKFAKQSDAIATLYGEKFPITFFKAIGEPGGTLMPEAWRPIATSSDKPSTGREDADKIMRFLERINTGSITSGPTKTGYTSPYFETVDERPYNRDIFSVLAANDPEYSNFEIKDRITVTTGIFPKFKTSYTSSTEEGHIPEKAIIGYTVVRPDGMVYEFNKPVFNFYQKTHSIIRNPAESKEKDYLAWGYSDYGDRESYTTMERAYATAWLITAIKKPDFVDIDGDNKVSDNDIGGWVRFEYDEDSHVPSYHYRTPYDGIAPLALGEDGAGKQSYFDSYGQISTGVKEIYYLTDIYTKTHHAEFLLSDRLDGRESWEVTNEVTLNRLNGSYYIEIKGLMPENRDVLSLEFDAYEVTEWVSGEGSKDEPTTISFDFNDPIEITNITYKNDKFSRYNGGKGNRRYYSDDFNGFPELLNEVETENGNGKIKINNAKIKFFSRNNSKLKKLDKINLYTRTYSNYDNQNLIKSVDFKYASDYPAADDRSNQLCPGIPNHWGAATDNVGKLTLRDVIISDGINSIPPYSFSYYKEGDNAPYNRFHWDRWGYYKSDGGQINTEITFGNVVDWAKMLLLLQEGQSLSDHWGEALYNELNIVTENRADLVCSVTDANDLKQWQKIKIGEAINNLVHNLNFFEDHKEYLIDLVEDMQRGDKHKFPKTRNMWKEYFTDGTRPLATINPDNTITLPDPFYNETTSKYPEFDSNSVYSLNMCALLEYVFLYDRSKITNDLPVEEADRYVMKHLDHDRFDHNVNVEDVNAWSIKEIAMPSGAKVQVDYESDDYSYVGKVRAVEPTVMEAVGEDLATIVKNADKEYVDDMSYFKTVSMEKSSNNHSSYLRFGGWGKSNVEKFVKDGNSRFDDIEIRSSSVFRVYRQVNGTWQLNPDFEKIKEWQEDWKAKNDIDPLTAGEMEKMHLVALFDPMIFVNSFYNPRFANCGEEPNDEHKEYPAVLYVPIDLGPIVGPNEEVKGGFFFIEESDYPNTTEGKAQYNEDVSKIACQRGYVDYNISRLYDERYWEYKDVQDFDDKLTTNLFQTCKIFAFNDEYHYFPEDRPIPSYYMIWGRKLEIDENNSETEVPDFYSDHTITVPIDGANVKLTWEEAAIKGKLKSCYKYYKNGDYSVWNADNSKIQYNGFYSWKYMSSFNRTSSDVGAAPGEVPEFESKYWDYYSVQSSIKRENPVTAGHVSGIPGGGLRVKNLTFNTGWSQLKGYPSNGRVTEYNYVCEGENGTLGNSSSGATPSEPGPYSNKGDDRIDVPPQIGMIKGGPSVKYGTIHESRKGRGKTVYNYLTSADIDNFITDDSSNYYAIDPVTNQKKLVKGAYDAYQADPDWITSRHHRWKSHSVAQFQGLPINEKQYSESGNLVTSKNMKYLTTMSSDEICVAEFNSYLNNVQSRIKDVFIPMEELKSFATDHETPFLKHKLSNRMGKTTERFKHRWINADVYDDYYSEDLRDWEIKVNKLDGIGTYDYPYQELYGINEMEVNEHGIYQYSIRELNYEGEETEYGKGVGTTTLNSYFDFLTGKPIVSTVMEATHEEPTRCSNSGEKAERCAECSGETNNDHRNGMETILDAKTTVNIPAYWVGGEDPGDNYSGMGPLFWHDEFQNAMLGDESSVATILREQKNMLNQPYSSSMYSNLVPPCGCEDCLPESDLTVDGVKFSREKYFNTFIIPEWKDDFDALVGDDYSIYQNEFTLWKKHIVKDGNNNDINIWFVDKKKVLRAPFDKTTRKLTTDPLILDNLVSPLTIPSNLTNNYITTVENVAYDNYGHPIEEKDVYGNSVTTFFDTKTHNLLKAGSVLNANRNSCVITAFDELVGVPVVDWPNGLNGIATGISNAFSRSGDYSFDLSQGNISITLGTVETGRTYELSFWIRNTNALTVNGVTKGNYDSKGAEWQRVVITPAITSGTITITGTSGHIDDIRYIPTDAQAFVMTNNNKGWMTSYSDANDVITYYNYDFMGQLIEVKDQQGVLISTQSRHEGK